VADIPQAAIGAARERLIKLLVHNRHILLGETESNVITREVLEAAEEAWPHEPPKRDPASTTTASTERAAQPRTSRAHGFGFGRPITAGGTHD
jgi:hypothetical protein